MYANKLQLWMYLQVEKLMYMESHKKLEKWKIWYALLWTHSCNTQPPVVHRQLLMSEWSRSRGYHEISALTLATSGVSHNWFLYPTCPATWWRWKKLLQSHSSVYLRILPPGDGPWNCNVGVWPDWRTEVCIRFFIIFMQGTYNYVPERSYVSRVLTFHLLCIYKFYYMLPHFPS